MQKISSESNNFPELVYIQGVPSGTASIVIWENIDPKYIKIWQHGKIPGANITKISRTLQNFQLYWKSIPTLLF